MLDYLLLKSGRTTTLKRRGFLKGMAWLSASLAVPKLLERDAHGQSVSPKSPDSRAIYISGLQLPSDEMEMCIRDSRQPIPRTKSRRS